LGNIRNQPYRRQGLGIKKENCLPASDQQIFLFKKNLIHQSVFRAQGYSESCQTAKLFFGGVLCRIVRITLKINKMRIICLYKLSLN
jgi:hypothetical protein